MSPVGEGKKSGKSYSFQQDIGEGLGSRKFYNFT